MINKLWCIRHETALHNILYKSIGERAYTEFYDTPLVKEEENESKQLEKEWNKINDINVVYVSPLARTLQTATNIFKNKNVKIIALEDIIEFSQGVHNANKRRKNEDLKIENIGIRIEWKQ